MTENLYELNHLTNDSNGAYLLQNNATPDYSISSSSSMLPSPMSPHVNQKHLPSPATPQNELHPLPDVAHGGGSWDYNQLEKSFPWGYSSKDEFTEAMGSHVVYPFSVVSHNSSALSSKFSASALQRLDSFSKAFPMKNPNIAFGNNEGEKCSVDHQGSEVLLSPQSVAASDCSDREPFSPVILQSQPQQHHNQLPYHPIDSQHTTHNFYQNHQQYHYGYQQHKPQRDIHSEQVHKVMLYKSQSQYHQQQQGIQFHQNQLSSYALASQKPFIPQIPLNVQEGHGSVESPTYCYGEEYKSPDQPTFSVVQRLPTHSPQFQESQHFRAHLSDEYQQLSDQTHSFSFKQNASLGDNHMASLDIVPGFSSPKEEVCTDFRRADLPSSQYQNMGSGVNQSPQTTTVREGALHHHNFINRQQWAQIHSNYQDNQGLPHYRLETEGSRGTGPNGKLKCVVCNREFKSLPALNGHMRSHGGFRAHLSTFKMGDHQIHQLQIPSKDVTQIDPMVLPVSVPVKDYQIPSKTPNSLHYHLPQNDLSDSAETCPQLPVPSQKDQSHLKAAPGVGECAAKRDKKRYRPCLVPLVISPCSADIKARGPVLFQSRLRSPSTCGDDTPYTPLPMLNPMRSSSGLFSNFSSGQHSTGTPTVPQVHLGTEYKVDDSSVTLGPGDKSSGMKPRINIGEDFQAEIPIIKSPSKATEDTHKAHLLWTPFHNETPENQQRVDNLLKMACSSVLPGGGTNTEYALHCLFECRGDVMAALEKLLTLRSLRHISRSQTDYHYAGSDKWTLQEKRQLNKAVLMHNKDFHLVQKMVKTKSVAQCVEYYYTWKKRLRLGRRLSTGRTTPGLEREVDLEEGSTGQLGQQTKNQAEMLNGNEWNQSSLGYYPAENRPKSAQQFTVSSVKSSPSNSTTSGDTDSTLIFPCTECGKVFFKVKSRNAHMKTHRQQDDQQLWQLRVPEQENHTVTPGSPSVIPLQLPTSHSLACHSEDMRMLPVNDTETLSRSDSRMHDPNTED